MLGLDLQSCSPTPAPKRQRILVIDDNPEFCQLMRHMLEPEGLEVVAVDNPLKALQLFHASSERFDLVMLDYYLPHMTGLETVEHLRRLDPGVKVLICSGLDEAALQHDAAKYNVHGIVRKPFRVTEMIAIIKQAVHERRCAPPPAA